MGFAVTNLRILKEAKNCETRREADVLLYEAVRVRLCTHHKAKGKNHTHTRTQRRGEANRRCWWWKGPVPSVTRRCSLQFPTARRVRPFRSIVEDSLATLQMQWLEFDIIVPHWARKLMAACSLHNSPRSSLRAMNSLFACNNHWASDVRRENKKGGKFPRILKFAIKKKADGKKTSVRGQLATREPEGEKIKRLIS